MFYSLAKAALSGVIGAAVSEIARPVFGALVASLPLVSVLGMMWLWRDPYDPVRLADHAAATLWSVVPSVPMFAPVPWLIRHGAGFRTALAAGCAPAVAA